MSKFNHYAKELNEIATGAFKSIKEADERLKQATDAMNKYNRYGGNIPYDMEAEHARAKADYLDAKAAYTAAKKNLSTDSEEIKTLRRNLVSDIEADNTADPAQLDSATLELLKSGILGANEYSRLLNQAKGNGNNTMMRLIGKYAADAAERTKDQWEASAFRVVYNDSRNLCGSDRLQAFDSMIDLMRRAENNPAGVAKLWDELTADIIANF